MSLRRASTIYIERMPTEGYWDASGRYVEPESLPPFELKCNIQPYREGKESILLPEGVTAESAQVIYCSVVLNTNDNLSGTEADRFELDGETYEIYRMVNRSRRPSPVAHYKYVAIRKPQETGGSL